jgi:DNA-binding MarR family transcriptional regulator
MGEQRQHSVEPPVQEPSTAGQMLAQGSRVRQQWGAQGATSSTRPQPNPGKEMPKDISQIPVASSSPKFPVRREESWEMFGLFVNAMLADVAVTRAGPPSDVPLTISPKLVRALLYLAQHGGRAMTVGELAEGVGVSLGWASRVADELVSIGLLERIRDEHDRRVVQLQLTPRATVISARLWSDREEAIVAALSEVFPEERQVIARFLRKLTTELELHSSKSGPVRS